jgi:RimJ/RimL family protein N-acetyltransferase
MARIEARNIKTRDGISVAIRSAEPTDAVSLLEFARKILTEDPYNVTLLEEFNMTVEQEQKWIQAHLDHPDQLALLATHENGIVGFLGMETRPRIQLRHVGMLHISIHKDFRRQGIARHMMQTLIDWAITHPTLEKLSLAVIPENIPALNLYKTLHFTEEGRRFREIKSPDGRYQDDVLMYKWL